MSWVTSCCRVALEQARVGLLDRGRGEDAGREGAEHAADAVDGEDVERVVDLEARAQQRGAVAQAAGDEADDERATDVDEAGRRGDGDEAGDGAARGTDDADLALVEHSSASDPGERRRRGGRVGDDEARWRPGRWRPSAEPALKPNQPNHSRPAPRTVIGTSCGSSALAVDGAAADEQRDDQGRRRPR